MSSACASLPIHKFKTPKNKFKKHQAIFLKYGTACINILFNRATHSRKIYHKWKNQHLEINAERDK